MAAALGETEHDAGPESITRVTSAPRPSTGIRRGEVPRGHARDRRRLSTPLAGRSHSASPRTDRPTRAPPWRVVAGNPGSSEADLTAYAVCAVTSVTARTRDRVGLRPRGPPIRSRHHPSRRLAERGRLADDGSAGLRFLDRSPRPGRPVGRSASSSAPSPSKALRESPEASIWRTGKGRRPPGPLSGCRSRARPPRPVRWRSGRMAERTKATVLKTVGGDSTWFESHSSRQHALRRP